MDQLLYKYAKIDLEQFAIFEENMSSPISEVAFENMFRLIMIKNMIRCAANLS